jgi:hypothetical protein
LNAPRDVTLSVLAARTDVRFMLHTIPHLVRMNDHPFAERVLVIDTAPVRGLYRSRPGIGSTEDLERCCATLVDAGVIDRVARIDYTAAFRRAAYRKHFGREVGHTHDAYGYPILGSVFAVEDCRTRYLLHFDCDMMMHQHPGHSWIDDAVRLMQLRSDVLFVSPLPGPPHPRGHLQRQEAYEREDGFYRMKVFTSRKFLVDRERFEACLPIEPRYVSWRARIRQALTSRSALHPWETMVSEFMKRSRYSRADLDSPRAWTLHPQDRGPGFFENLPALLDAIEAGVYPPDQAGEYDIVLPSWLALVRSRAGSG